MLESKKVAGFVISVISVLAVWLGVDHLKKIRITRIHSTYHLVDLDNI